MDEEQGGFLRGAPDLFAEVLSPRNRRTEMETKTQEWLAAGCQVVWIVDPDRRTISVHEPGHEAAILRSGDVLTCPKLLPGFALPVAKIFAPPRSRRADA